MEQKPLEMMQVLGYLLTCKSNVWTLLVKLQQPMLPPVAAFRKPFGFRDLRADTQQVTEQLSVFVLGVCQAHDRLAWDDQHVDRRLRLDVEERDRVLVLVDQIGGDLTPQDLAEDGVAHG